MTDLSDVLVDASGEAVAQSNAPGKFVQMVRGWPIRPRMYTARGFGEAASVIAAPVASIVVDQTLRDPYSDLKNRISKAFVEPNLEWWDGALAKAKSLDPPHEREERKGLSREEQARKITDLLVDQFGLKFGASVLAQFATQDYFMNKFGSPVSKRNNLVSIAFDRSVQLGSAVLVNTALSDQAIAAQNGLIKVFKSAGMEEEKAEEWANYAVNFSLPNLLAYLASSELLTQMAKRGR